MAVPKVFLSSTCYDLGQVRDILSEFIDNYCFEAQLSEHGDVFYHPDLHTHESCINEIENCQLFILIIGGRHGGEYKFDKKKSITNAEYEAAKYKKIPVFTFVKKDLLDDHKLYQKNKHNEAIIKEIIFPSIENQEHAISIFEFINQVRSADVNNGFFPFEFAKDITKLLAKQWAGMMFNFLNERVKDYNQKMVNKTLDNLALINKRTEELVENIVRNLNPQEGEKQIEDLDKVILASKFFTSILSMYRMQNFTKSTSELVEIEPSNQTWYQYISSFPDFFLRNPSEEEKLHYTDYNASLYLVHGPVIWTVLSEIDEYPDQVQKASELFENVKILSKTERQKALEIALSNKV